MVEDRRRVAEGRYLAAFTRKLDQRLKRIERHLGFDQPEGATPYRPRQDEVSDRGHDER